MQTRPLGCSDLKITSLGIGTWAIGGPEGDWNWGPQNDADSIAAIRGALDLGLNWIDTAPAYGKGHSEEVVGKAIQGRFAQALYFHQEFTGLGKGWKYHELPQGRLDPQGMRGQPEALEGGGPGPLADPLAQPGADLEEGWAEMARLQKAGKVRWIGVSNFSISQMKRAQAIAPVASLQPPYSATPAGHRGGNTPLLRP